MVNTSRDKKLRGWGSANYAFVCCSLFNHSSEHTSCAGVL